MALPVRLDQVTYPVHLAKGDRIYFMSGRREMAYDLTTNHLTLESDDDIKKFIRQKILVFVKKGDR